MILNDEFKDFVGNLAVLTTVLQFLSGVLVCRQYVVNRTTAEASPLPFVCGALSAGLWLLYGLNKHDDKIILVNIIGLTLMIAYTSVFYIFTFKKSSVLKQVLITVTLMIFMIGYVYTEKNTNLLLNHLGLSACCLTLLTVAAPMSKLWYVLRVKSTECLPFPMILMSFFVSALWFMYGVMDEDTYLTLPNFIGGVLAVSQLSLFVIFPSTPSTKAFSKSILA